jgi:hypothetical protein
LICVLLVALASFVIGLLGWGAAGVCDTSCPSDQALANYKRLFWGGGGAFALVTIWLILRALRRRRRARESDEV